MALESADQEDEDEEEEEAAPAAEPTVGYLRLVCRGEEDFEPVEVLDAWLLAKVRTEGGREAGAGGAARGSAQPGPETGA